MVWLLVAAGLRPPATLKPHLSPRSLDGIEARLLAVPGVEEAAVAPGEGVAHLKVDSGRVDWARLQVAVVGAEVRADAVA